MWNNKCKTIFQSEKNQLSKGKKRPLFFKNRGICLSSIISQKLLTSHMKFLHIQKIQPILNNISEKIKGNYKNLN